MLVSNMGRVWDYKMHHCVVVSYRLGLVLACWDDQNDLGDLEKFGV